MSLAILFHFFCTQYVSDINISIIRSLRLCRWIATLVVLFLVRCVLEFRCGWVWVVSVLQAAAVTVTCCERGWVRKTGGSNGLRNARYCRYSDMSCWRWVKYHPKYVEQLTGLNKLYYVASSWIIIAIFYDVWSIEHKIYVHLLFCLKSCRLWDNVEKLCGEGQSTGDNMTHVHCRLDTKGYNYTLIAFPR